jgi:predicted nucleic acid-binding protein
VALTHLLDTSVVKRLANHSVRAVVEQLALAGSVARSQIVDLEVCFSARNEEEWDSLSAALDDFALIGTTSAHSRRALQVQRLLAVRGRRGRKIPDLLIAAAAEERGLVALHYDADFDLIGAVTGQPTEWVVESGTVE